MEWLNLHTSVLDSPAFLGAEPLDRATWLCLLRYCIGQENSGIIDNCSEWGDRKWQQLCRVKLREVNRQCDLFQWLDGSLIVHQYPVKKQQEVQRLRSVAKSGSDARWDALRQNEGLCQDDALRHPDGTCGREGKEKGKEGEGEVGALTPKVSLKGNRERLAKFAKSKRLSASDDSIEELIGLARDMGCSGIDETINMIGWSVDEARRVRDREVRYARHFEAEAKLWSKQKRETERIKKEAS